MHLNKFYKLIKMIYRLVWILTRIFGIFQYQFSISSEYYQEIKWGKMGKIENKKIWMVIRFYDEMRIIKLELRYIYLYNNKSYLFNHK